MARDGPPYGEETLLSARYALPSQVAEHIGDMPWETVIGMASSMSARHESHSPEVRKLSKEIALKRLILLEKARVCSAEGKFDPRLLVDLVRLLEKCERMAKDYEMDLGDFNTFLYLLIAKVKKEKLARHEPQKRQIAGFSPMDENELDEMKRKSESIGRKKK